MLVVFMLKKLARLAKGLSTVATVVGEFRDSVVAIVLIAILQHGHVVHVALHALLLTRKVVNGPASIVLAKTAATIATFHMLHGIGTGPKARIATHRACNIARTMRLHVHGELILRVERSVAFLALIGHRT